ncbi:hypothetical protein JQC92_04880 [Shewanella sp. 202IG2-18]|uniref:hypothetical protein n=1 Tax=Parashewanella hymeniacidonis TaxID=2807618 RepID=UPI00195F9BC1|nr:hypothetical protein [Parashewanella hymeniacidonis]MBM7071378.1 hypothetical protein [Parashewanella hymeniacidonis]
MPEIQMRAASNNDWPFVNLLCSKDLKNYLNATWPYQPEKSQFFKLKRSKFLQGRTTVINYDGVDIGVVSIKRGIDEVFIEDISLWFDTDENEIAKIIINDIIENKVEKGCMVKCSLAHNNPLIDVYKGSGFNPDYETDHRVYLRYIK